MKNYQDFIDQKTRQYGDKFDDTGLSKQFITYYENQRRIEVDFCSKDGRVYETKRGRVGVTTEWRPRFLLVLTPRSLGSVYRKFNPRYCLSDNDKIRLY